MACLGTIYKFLHLTGIQVQVGQVFFFFRENLLAHPRTYFGRRLVPYCKQKPYWFKFVEHIDTKWKRWTSLIFFFSSFSSLLYWLFSNLFLPLPTGSLCSVLISWYPPGESICCLWYEESIFTWLDRCYFYWIFHY